MEVLIQKSGPLDEFSQSEHICVTSNQTKKQYNMRGVRHPPLAAAFLIA